MLINRNSKTNAPRQKRGQSTVEYIILVSAVIGVVILFIANPNSMFKTKINEVYNTVYSDIADRAEVMASSHNGTYIVPNDTQNTYIANVLGNLL